jgi:uncharacterized membrane protein
MSEALKEKPYAEEVPASAGAGVVVNGRYLPPPADKDGKLWVRTTALIQAEPEVLYRLWRNVETIPLWQEEVVEVIPTGPATSHWTVKSGDKTVEWDSEILADEPGRRIAWKSTGGEPENAGEVVFEEAPGGRGTITTVLQEFRLGKVASAVATLTGRNPKQAVIENLRHFKALAETGEIPRTQGQPHGPRGTIGGAKESVYGEKIATPPGTNAVDFGRKAS